jgi:hypothetical protein
MALNDMGRDMHPMNWASKAVKTSSDILFSMGLNDPASVASRIRELEDVIVEMKKSCRAFCPEFKDE